MPSIEVSLPDRLDSEIDRLVEQGDFINREQAMEELLSQGLSAYDTTETTEEETYEEMFSGEQGDPAARDDGDEERTF